MLPYIENKPNETHPSKICSSPFVAGDSSWAMSPGKEPLPHFIIWENNNLMKINESVIH